MALGRMFLCGVAGIAMSTASNASAQDSAAPRTADNESLLGDEIVVTAQKREQNLQNVGLSIAAVSGDSLEALGLSQAADIATIVPAVNIQSVGGTDAQLVVNIRGVSQNDFGDHNEPPVAVYVDDAYVSWLGAVGTTSYDMERVEVLRGPQGTLFGRNSTGGLIHFLSRRPTQNFDARVAARMGSHSSFGIDGAIGGGIGEIGAVRLAGVYERNSDYVNNRVGHDLGRSESWALRGQALFFLGGDSDLLLKAEYSHSTGSGSTWTHRAAAPDPTRHGIGRFLGASETFYDPTLLGTPGCAGCDALGYKDDDGKTDTVDQNAPSYFRRKIFNGQAKFNVDLGSATLVSISDYRWIKRRFADDSDGGPYTISAFRQDINPGKQFSQEVRLSGDTGKLDWVVGGYYLWIDGDYLARLDTTYTGDPAQDFVASNWNLKTTSYALFGQAEYALTDAVALIGGLRWTKDRKHFSYANTDGLGGGVLGGGLIFNTGTVGALARRNENSASFKAGVNWRINPDVMLYANISRGTKAGGFTGSLDGLLQPAEVPYRPEKLTSYEAGFKTSLAPGVKLNGSAFYYDYNDYQAFTFQGISQKIVNLDARIYGAEAELLGSPARGLDLMLGLSWLNSKAFDVPMPDGTVLDRTLPQAPSFSIKGFVRQSFDLGSGKIAAQIDGSYQTKSNFNIVRHDTTAVGAYANFNGRLTYSRDDSGWSIAAFVDNLFDKRVAVSAIDISGLLTGGASLRAMNRPRWVGAEFRLELR